MSRQSKVGFEPPKRSFWYKSNEVWPKLEKKLCDEVAVAEVVVVMNSREDVHIE